MAGGLGPAYGQTDVMHDRSYLMAQLANRSRAVREQARIALAELNRQEALQQRDDYLQQRDAALQQRQMNYEATQRRIIAHQNAMEMDKQLKIDRDTEIDEQGHGLLLSMMKLDAAKRRGEITKEQYDDGILNAATQFPMGLNHPEAKKHLEFVTKEADRENAFLARRKVIEDAKTATRLTGPPPEKIAERYSRVQGTLSQYQNAYESDVKRQEKANLGTSNVPYNPSLDKESRIITSNLEGAKREAQLLEQSYPQLTGQVQQTQSAVNTPTPTPASTPAPSPTPDTRPIPGFNIPILENTSPPQPTAEPISTPSPSPEATATPAPQFEPRTINGVTYQWSGKQWEPQDQQ